MEPSVKGYQKGTQKSENIRLGNDKKLKELLKTIHDPSSHEHEHGQNSLANKQNKSRITALNQPSNTSDNEAHNSPMKMYGLDEDREFMSASRSLRPGASHLQSDTIFDSKKNSLTVQSGYNTVFVTGEKTIAAPPAVDSTRGIAPAATVQNPTDYQKAPSNELLIQ